MLDYRQSALGACLYANSAGDALERRVDVRMEEHGSGGTELDANEAGCALFPVYLDYAIFVPLKRHRRTDGDAAAALVANSDVGQACYVLDGDTRHPGVVLLGPRLGACGHTRSAHDALVE